MARSSPHRVADLIGYQSLIISASQKHPAGWWVIYDRRFPLKASATKNTEWSAYDVTIWNQVFPDSVMVNYHSRQPQSTHSSNSIYRPPRQSQTNYRWQVCLNWNDSSDGCTRSTCWYDHICYRCVHNPRVIDKDIKPLTAHTKKNVHQLSGTKNVWLYNGVMGTS